MVPVASASCSAPLMVARAVTVNGPTATPRDQELAGGVRAAAVLAEARGVGEVDVGVGGWACWRCPCPPPWPARSPTVRVIGAATFLICASSASTTVPGIDSDGDRPFQGLARLDHERRLRGRRSTDERRPARRRSPRSGGRSARPAGRRRTRPGARCPLSPSVVVTRSVAEASRVTVSDCSSPPVVIVPVALPVVEGVVGPPRVADADGEAALRDVGDGEVALAVRAPGRLLEPGGVAHAGRRARPPRGCPLGSRTVSNTEPTGSRMTFCTVTWFSVTRERDRLPGRRRSGR